MGRAHSGKTRSEASVGIQGRVGDGLDQGAGQYPKHAGLQGGKNIEFISAFLTCGTGLTPSKYSGKCCSMNGDNFSKVSGL